ncbi:hypothetical protein [Stenotrophomonas lactitubi]|nr:hypothetical protein [Stenotrophomonas lactitubi]
MAELMPELVRIGGPIKESQQGDKACKRPTVVHARHLLQIDP